MYPYQLLCSSRALVRRQDCFVGTCRGCISPPSRNLGRRATPGWRSRMRKRSMRFVGSSGRIRGALRTCLCWWDGVSLVYFIIRVSFSRSLLFTALASQSCSCISTAHFKLFHLWVQVGLTRISNQGRVHMDAFAISSAICPNPNN